VVNKVANGFSGEEIAAARGVLAALRRKLERENSDPS
jgi:hypothetical protein